MGHGGGWWKERVDVLIGGGGGGAFGFERGLRRGKSWESDFSMVPLVCC